MAEHRKLPVASCDFSDSRPTVALCAGKDCRKRCEFAKVRKVLDRDCNIVDLKCIGLCNGPVLVTHLDAASPSVYAKLRSKRDRRLLVDLASGDRHAVKQLADKQVDKKKTVTSVTRQLKRRMA